EAVFTAARRPSARDTLPCNRSTDRAIGRNRSTGRLVPALIAAPVSRASGARALARAERDPGSSARVAKRIIGTCLTAWSPFGIPAPVFLFLSEMNQVPRPARAQKPKCADLARLAAPTAGKVHRYLLPITGKNRQQLAVSGAREREVRRRAEIKA